MAARSTLFDVLAASSTVATSPVSSVGIGSAKADLRSLDCFLDICEAMPDVDSASEADRLPRPDGVEGLSGSKVRAVDFRLRSELLPIRGPSLISG